MLFSRYGQGETVLNMPFPEGLELINFARMEKVNEMILHRWITHYEQEMSFEEFKQKLGIGGQKEEKKIEDILVDLKKTFG